MLALEVTAGHSTLDEALADSVRIRASQVSGCMFRFVLHATGARKHGETERRLATAAA